MLKKIAKILFVIGLGAATAILVFDEVIVSINEIPSTADEDPLYDPHRGYC